MASDFIQYNSDHTFSNLGAELVFTQNVLGEYISFYWRSHLVEKYYESKPNTSLLPKFEPMAKDVYLQKIQRVINRRISEHCNCLFDFEGQVIAFELNITPILGKGRNIELVFVTGCQIPDYDFALSCTSSLPTNSDPCQKLLIRVARKIRRSLDLDIIGQQIVESLGEALKVSRCQLLMVSSDNKTVEVKKEFCDIYFSPQLGFRFPLKDYPEIQKIFSLRQATVINPESYPKGGIFSLLLVPTFYQQEFNGIICLQQCDRPRIWHEAELELVQELGDQVGTAIGHANIYQKLEIANKEAEEASRLKSEFLASTSHELRTPLNGILGFLKLVIDDMADDREEEREFIAQAYHSALHLLNLINDILDIAKIEAGKMEFELTSISLREICDDIYKFVHNQAEKKKLYFQINLPPTYDEILLYADYQRLLQVMLNVIGNSLKFTHEGGVEIKAEIIPKPVSYQDINLPGIVKISVKDTGIGVSLDKQERLFETFYQVDGSRTKTYGGTGLGLAISKRLVEAMGGNISFYSMGEFLGTTVTFTIPLSQLPILKTRDN